MTHRLSFRSGLLFGLGMLLLLGAVPVEAAKRMYIVAHEDDDLLFMNPDIQESIDQRHQVRTMFLTAGDSCKSSTYWRGRENGTKAAYAEMRGVSNSWTFVSQYKSARLYELSGTAASVVFFRLPGGVCHAQTDSLRLLWEGKIGTLTSVDGAASYSKQDLIDTILSRMKDFAPDFIGIQDATAQAPSGVNPYDYKIYYPLCGFTNMSDHPDHISSARFAGAARDAYRSTRAHTFVQYRGYNITNRPENLNCAEASRKLEVFEEYAKYDPAIKVPLDCWYSSWTERQYYERLSEKVHACAKRLTINRDMAR
jgi:LmbE family N-acetylglucosaminyl deacetylase